MIPREKFYTVNPVDTSKKGSKQDAVILYSINFDELPAGAKITKQLTPFDKRCYIAAAALFNAGNDIISATQIYRMMGNTGNPKAGDLQKVSDSLTKMGATQISIDNPKYEGALLPFERISAYINGQLAESAIHLFREPPLISLYIDPEYEKLADVCFDEVAKANKNT